MIDEAEATASFVELVGGRDRADQLFRLLTTSYPSCNKTKREVFIARAKAHGFTDEEINALLALQ